MSEFQHVKKLTRCSYIQARSKRPKSPVDLRITMAKRQHRNKMQRALDRIKEGSLQPIKTIDFDEFRQNFKQDHDAHQPAITDLQSATDRARQSVPLRPMMVRKRPTHRALPRTRYTPIPDDESVDAYSPSVEWMQRHGHGEPMPPRPRVPRIPQLQFTSRSPPPQQSGPGQQATSTSGPTTHRQQDHSNVTSDAPNGPVSRSASHAPEPAPSAEHIGHNLPNQRTRQVRVQSARQDRIDDIDTLQVDQDLAERDTSGDPLAEENLQIIRQFAESQQRFAADPIDNEDFPSVPSSLRRTVEATAAVPETSAEEVAKALTGLAMTDHLMKMLQTTTIKPDRTSAPSLRQMKLTERRRRVQQKRQQLSKSPIDHAVLIEHPTEQACTLVPTQVREVDPEVARRKSDVKSARSRVGLSRSKAVGSMSSQPTSKQLKKLYEKKSAAALSIRAYRSAYLTDHSKHTKTLLNLLKGSLLNLERAGIFITRSSRKNPSNSKTPRAQVR